MAQQVVNNFIRTTLAAPAAPSDVTLQLAAGAGALFNMPAGNWCYVTVNDSTTVEIMKYTSTGSVAGDLISVARGQDNTTPKAFPAGSCVAVGWNTAQVQAFVEALIPVTPPIPPSPGGIVAILSEGSLSPTGSLYNAGSVNFAALGLPHLINYDPGSTGVLTFSNTGRIKFNANCIAALTATVHGEVYAFDQPNPFMGAVDFTNTNDTTLIGNVTSLPSTGTGYPLEVTMSATTPMTAIPANEEWDANILIYALSPAFARITVHQLELSATVYALT